MEVSNSLWFNCKLIKNDLAILRIFESRLAKSPSPFGRGYPAILAFAGGRQNLDAVNNTLERNWLPEAEARGYIIVSPIAPPNHFFFGTARPEGIARPLYPMAAEDMRR